MFLFFIQTILKSFIKLGTKENLCFRHPKVFIKELLPSKTSYGESEFNIGLIDYGRPHTYRASVYMKIELPLEAAAFEKSI